jgi:hypothetical protein
MTYLNVSMRLSCAKINAQVCGVVCVNLLLWSAIGHADESTRSLPRRQSVGYIRSVAPLLRLSKINKPPRDLMPDPIRFVVPLHAREGTALALTGALGETDGVIVRLGFDFEIGHGN